ncbi:MAG: permease-like cell division protein FtsX [Acidimicrobiales bacterium]
MAISVDYVVRETAMNLRRNLLMTIAAVLTVGVSLSLVGSALLLRQGVSKATIQWRGGVELSIFMNPDVAAQQRDSIEAQLEQMPEVKRITFVDQEASYAEFTTMFSNSPDFYESVTATDLPPSFRVVPQQPEFADGVGERFKGVEGVRDVVYAKDTVKTLLTVTRYLQLGFATVAAVLLLSALLLILNTIRMAIFSRRREVAVMKLVGATNWFIRVPFMLEGMIQGLVGGAAAFGVVWAARAAVDRVIQNNELFREFAVSTSDVVGTGIFILIIGALVGAIGSAFAVSRFLDV